MTIVYLDRASLPEAAANFPEQQIRPYRRRQEKERTQVCQERWSRIQDTQRGKSVLSIECMGDLILVYQLEDLMLDLSLIQFDLFQAIEGTYIDKKCPFTGNVSIRGRILTGIVKSKKMKRTIVLRRDYLHYIKKYNRFEKRHRNISVHCSPCFR